MPSDYTIDQVVAELGNGERVTAPDTVPFCIWSAARHVGRFEEAMWATVAASGDMDTNCAIAGGIIASDLNLKLPRTWLSKREPLPAPIF